MPAFKDIHSLCAYAQAKIDASLKEDVAPLVKDVLHNNIEADVYGRYSPVKYSRRGALGSQENMVDELEGKGVLSVRDTASPSPSVIGTPYSPADDTAFSGWINNGNVPNIFNNNDYPWMYPAGFIEDTREELSDGTRVREALKTGMLKQGILAE